MSRHSVGTGIQAPDFILKNEQDQEWRLGDHRGSTVTLLFYPKDETLVCTKQLCSVRDNWEEYLKTKSVVVGIARGTVEEHRSFARHHQLPLTLLADPDGLVTKTYAQGGWLPWWLTRAVVVIDGKGIIRHRRVMLRTSRPSDYSVIASIYSAQTDIHLQKYDEILGQFRQTRGD